MWLSRELCETGSAQRDGVGALPVLLALALRHIPTPPTLKAPHSRDRASTTGRRQLEPG